MISLLAIERFIPFMMMLKELLMERPVTVNGFPVGSITDISFFKNNSLLVKFRVENDIKFSVNSIAQIYETGLIGGKALSYHSSYG